MNYFCFFERIHVCGLIVWYIENTNAKTNNTMNMVANRVRMFSTKWKSYIEQKASKIGDKTIMPTSYKDYNEKDSVLSKMQKVSTSKYNRKMPKDYYINEGIMVLMFWFTYNLRRKENIKPEQRKKEFSI